MMRKALLILIGIVLAGVNCEEVTSASHKEESPHQEDEEESLHSTHPVNPVHWETDLRDSCVDTAKKDMRDTLGRNYPQFDNVTMNLTSPRDLYRALFNQSFNQTTFESYCKTYRTCKMELTNCTNSTAKSLALLQFTFADYICIRRANEYSKNIVCLQTINNDAEAYQCRGKCNADQNVSEVPSANATKEHLTQFAVGECLYAKCMVDCRKSVIEKKCGADKSDLELEALKMALSTEQSLSDTADALKTYISNAFQSVFPEECREAMSTPLHNLAAKANEYLSTAMNRTAKLFQSIQPHPTSNEHDSGSETTGSPENAASSIRNTFQAMVVVYVVWLASQFGHG